MNCLALIPARSGSKRVKDKNISLVQKHPLMAYTISPAISSSVFDKVLVSTDDENYAQIAREYGAEVPFLRPKDISGERSPDIEWVQHALQYLEADGYKADCFSILRPTSPLRQPETIRRAWQAFSADPQAHSLRAVEKCVQHPAKMWYIKDNRLSPVLVGHNEDGVPWHSMQYQSLPAIYAQNASLEIARSEVALEMDSIAGTEIMPFISEGYEGFDINYPYDLIVLNHLIETGQVKLPEVKKIL
jgi:CMP-N,N'-diacetyllegionaminic acid synthase